MSAPALGPTVEHDEPWRNELGMWHHPNVVLEIDGEKQCVDREIADAVRILNERGLRTHACCQGDVEQCLPGRLAEAYISFERRSVPPKMRQYIAEMFAEFQVTDRPGTFVVYAASRNERGPETNLEQNARFRERLDALVRQISSPHFDLERPVAEPQHALGF